VEDRRTFLKKSVVAAAALSIPTASSYGCLGTIQAKIPMKTRLIGFQAFLKLKDIKIKKPAAL
jgi:hypothetical protein